MTLDSFVALLSDTAWKLVPVAVVILLIYLIVLLAARNHRRRREAMLRDLARPAHRRNRDELEWMDLHDLE